MTNATPAAKKKTPAKKTPAPKKDDRTIEERMAAVMVGVTAIGKSAKNEASGYAARSIDDVLDVMHTILAAEGVFVLPNVEKVEYVDREVTTNQGKKKTVVDCRIKMTYRFVAPDGSTVSMKVASEGRDYADKATNKASSNAFKYGLLHAFLIPVSSPDADTESIEVDAPAPPPVRRRTTKPKPEPKEHPDLRARTAVLSYANGEKSAAKAVWGRLCAQLGFDPDSILESESDANAVVTLVAELTKANAAAEASETSEEPPVSDYSS